jgi:diguanylate cyclase (GGDEF)-like protein
LVANVIGDIVLANQGLQSKLDTAEGRLQEQAVEIEAHISRSLTDPLTGLPNRREFNERLEERMGAWNRRREVFSLLLLDVDHFKKLNDQHGHLAGDQMLAAIGGALRGAIRREDTIARYGGEEFAILLPSTSLEQAALVAEKVREAAARTVVSHNQHKIAVTVSGGIATIQPNERVEALIQRADAALYAAKAAGRNCACVHDGVDCRLANGDVEVQQFGPAARLVELINSPDAGKPPAEDATNASATGFGSYLPREAISAALAETCQELRRFLEKRGHAEEPASPAPQP